MNRFKTYLLAVRPWSFTASMMPLLLGSALAYSYLRTISIHILFLTSVSTLCVHAAGNLFNTYYDYIHGVDIPPNINKTGKTNEIDNIDDRTLIDGLLKPNEIVRLGLILYAIGTIAFVLLTYYSPAKEPYLALIYFGALPLSFLYTGGIGFKYIALGDILILLTFGPITVISSYMAQTGQYSIYPILYALPLTLSTEAILHSNNTRDMEHDRSVGILTLSIILGKRYSYYVYCLLMYSPYVIISYIIINISWFCFLPFFTIKHAYHLCEEFKHEQFIKLPNRTAKFNFLFGFLYILSIIISNTVQKDQKFVF
ncbi:unnamed protein product [Adineta steineri]|uniref:1,4-dihydroxy-2-naphthoate octaprenyltransferase n=1 Tax=Adineta steineri TaxID=433720 RepID=A0A815CIQ8_9BILA|nr:unnamed protein product [Adineta steineri]CAF1280869.1 unnamed protein product [Adineta steineri]CAF1317430.1 unnamed protein product [Adineta steineri]CAF1530341.1 unnamed protein product [Adineta steineri]CAF3770340.1 unnamed protein product [Adineta steineri]